MERRGARKVDPPKDAPGARSSGPFAGYVRLDGIAAKAKKCPQEKMHALMHHLNVENLRQAFRELDGSKASGIDGVTKQEYAQRLESHLQTLAEQIRKGGWRPRPSREVLIPKPQGGMRPIAIGCLEDKIVQLATARILEAIFEPLFTERSYGFRRGKSAHQAVGRLYEEIVRRKKNCTVVEMDIEKFFNSVDHDFLLQSLRQRIDDERFLRHVRRLLRNSILHQDGELTPTVLGTPQGSPVSPILANIVLHFLLDTWFLSNYGNDATIVRFADDAVFLFESEEQAQAFQNALVLRMQEGALRLNLDKSGVIPFRQKAPKGTVSFLGFEYYWGKTRRGTRSTLKVKTRAKKLHHAMKTFYHWIKERRNREPLKNLWKTAEAKIRGHFNYFAVTFNQSRLNHFYWECLNSLFKWLNRRSQKRSYNWEQFKNRLWFNPLPKPPLGYELRDITNETRAAKHFSKSRMRENRTSGSNRSAGQQCPAFT